MAMVMRNRKIPIFYTFVPLARYKMENPFWRKYYLIIKLHNGVAFVVWRNKCKGKNIPSVKRQRQGPIGMHCDAPKSVPDPFPSVNPSIKTSKLPLPLTFGVGTP